MFKSFLGALGILRPGALVDEEEQNLLSQELAALERTPDWAEKAAVVISAVSQQPTPKVIDMLQMFIWKVKSSRDSVPVSHIRLWSDTIEKINNLLNAPASAIPAPTAPAPPIPEPAPAPAPAPTGADEAANPPPPPGLVCPHYNRGEAPPGNWNDPAAAERYLTKYPDVKEAVDRNIQPSAIWHYRCYGKKEGRTWAGWGGLGSYRRKLRPNRLGDYRFGTQSFNQRGFKRPGNLQ